MRFYYLKKTKLVKKGVKSPKRSFFSKGTLYLCIFVYLCVKIF